MTITVIQMCIVLFFVLLFCMCHQYHHWQHRTRSQKCLPTSRAPGVSYFHILSCSMYHQQFSSGLVAIWHIYLVRQLPCTCIIALVMFSLGFNYVITFCSQVRCIKPNSWPRGWPCFCYTRNEAGFSVRRRAVRCITRR